MMISRSEKFIYFSLTLILLPYLLFGGSYRYITTENGLKNNAVYVITQDSKGLMWFGTIIGLYNYDGNTIKNIPPDSELGVGTLIYSITEDSQSRLWIGTNTGLSILDLKTEKYLPFDYCTPENTHIKSAVRNVMIDSRGTAWISTMGQGIFLFDLKKGTLSQITTPDIPDNMIKHTMEGRKGNIWITTINGFLIKYNPGIKEFTVFKDDKIHKGWIGYEDMEANIWMGTAGGLFLFNKKTGHFSQKVMPLKPDGILEIKSIVEPEPGELLLATDEGLIHYNIHSGKIIIEKGESLHQPGLNDNYLHALYLDRENGLWVGTYFGGINYLSPTSSNFGLLDNIDKRLNVKVVSVFAKDSTDNLWIGTDDAGILYVNRKTGKIISFNPEKSNIKVPTYQNIHALLVDGDNLYIGMYMGGLDIYNTKTGKLKNFHQSNSVNSFSSNIYALYKDMYGIIWIGTQGGLNTYDPRIGKFHYCNELGNIDVSNIKEDTGGNLWVSTLGNGIFRLNRKTGKWKNYYPVTSDNIRITRITYICFDESRNLWIGTEENGLCRFDYKKESFTNYPLKDAPSQVVYCIIPDKNYLWISTTNGIIQFDRSSGKIKCFNMGDGLTSNQFSPAAGIKLNDGTIIFGNINGLNAFDPSRMITNEQDPDIILTDLLIFNRSVKINSEKSPLKKEIRYTKRITLKHRQSAFSIRFATLSFINSIKTQYFYKLQGFDKNWNKVKYPQATYTNLPAGNYKFIVKTGFNDNDLSQKEATLEIKVLAPVMLSMPFILLYIILLISLCIYGYERVRKNHENKIKQINLENEKALYDSKMKLYTNIVHELRTPLTLIMGPLNLIMKGKGPVSDYASELGVIKSNSKRLLDLINSLMDYRKIKAGGENLKIGKTDICFILLQIYNRFKISAELKNVNIYINLPDENCYAMVDPEAFTKIISNLISNALKFTSSFVKISLVKTEDRLDITVEDNGIGISRENQSKIFEAFYQVKENTPSDNIGSGVGLVIVKELVYKMNGTIKLDSSPCKGAKFIVSFQNGETEEEETGLPSSHISKELPQEPDIRNKIYTILITEDNTDMRNYLKTLFDKDYEIITATDGRTAYEKLSERKTDLVISDIMMPGIDGIELCKKIKTNIEFSHIPVILLTAKVDPVDKIEGYRNFADAYIEKPFDEDILKTQVKSIILNREKLKENFIKQPTSLISSIASSDADKTFLNKITSIINKNINDPSFSVDALASDLCMGRSNFYNKVKAVSGTTPNELLKIMRLKNAALLLAKRKGNINEISYMVGFSSPSYFAKCFLQQFGLNPSEYMKKIKK